MQNQQPVMIQQPQQKTLFDYLGPLGSLVGSVFGIPWLGVLTGMAGQHGQPQQTVTPQINNTQTMGNNVFSAAQQFSNYPYIQPNINWWDNWSNLYGGNK